MVRSNLSSWWAKRCAVVALCTHLIEHGDEWQRSQGVLSDKEIFSFGSLVVTRKHKYGTDSPTGPILVNNVKMSWWASRKLHKALKRRGNGLKIYRNIVSALKPANTPLQIEDAKSS